MPPAKAARIANASSKKPRSAAAPNRTGLVAPSVNPIDRRIPNPVPRTSAGRERSSDGSSRISLLGAIETES
jgi:hypothetical protein